MRLSKDSVKTRIFVNLIIVYHSGISCCVFIYPFNPDVIVSHLKIHEQVGGFNNTLYCLVRVMSS